MLSVTETVTVTSQNLSAAGPCAQATQAQAHRGLGRAMGRGAVGRGSGLPCGQRAACKSTGDGRERGRRPCLRAPPHSPASRVCSSGGAQPRPPSTLPACAGTQGAVGVCVFATALHSPPGGGLFSAAGSAAHARGPLCASACNVIWPPAARVAFPPCARRTARRSHGAAVVGLRACVACAHRRRQSQRLRPRRSRGDPQAAPRGARIRLCRRRLLD